MDEQRPDEPQQPESGGEPLYVRREGVEEEWIEPVGWPKPIGIISLVLAAIGLTCTGCGIGAQLIFGPMQKQLYTDGMPPAALSLTPMIYASAVIGLLVTILLIVAAIMLLARNLKAHPLFLVYAVLGIISAAFGMYAQIDMQSEITEWVKQNPDTTYSQQVGANAAGQVIGIVLGIVLGFAWPVFCLLWFGLVKRDPSEIRRGVEGVV